MMMICCFMPLSILFKSYPNDRRVIINSSLQWTVQTSRAIFHQKALLVWSSEMLQLCSQDSLWHTGSWKAYAWEAQDHMEAADREGSQRVEAHDRHTWRSGVRSAMRAASQLPGRGPLMWLLPLQKCSDDDKWDLVILSHPDIWFTRTNFTIMCYLQI